MKITIRLRPHHLHRAANPQIHRYRLAQGVPGGNAYQAAPAQAPESQAACRGPCYSAILFVLWKVSTAKKAAYFQSSAQSVHLAAE